MDKPFSRSHHRMERVTLYVDATTKVLLQRAASVRGLPLAEFIQDSAKVRAQHLLSQSMVTRVSDGEFCRVLDAIESPPAPTGDLIKALRSSS